MLQTLQLIAQKDQTFANELASTLTPVKKESGLVYFIVNETENE
jgi:hypothetical protein